MDALSLIKDIGDILSHENAIQAAWLSGSHGRGDPDAHSDIDITAYASTDQVNEVFSSIIKIINKKPEVIFTKIISGHILNAITQDWQRFDITVIDESGLGAYSRNETVMLFDKAHIKARMTDDPVLVTYTLEQIKETVEEFLRIIGLLPVVMARNDYVTGQTGAQLLRDLLLKLIKMEAAPHIGRGVLSFKKAVSNENYCLLQRMPPLCATRDQVLAAHVYLAETFLLKAKALYLRYAMDWPTRFEAAALARLAKARG